MKIGIIGLGFVGSAMHNSFKELINDKIVTYDKYKLGGIGSLENCLKTDILFLALPTQYNKTTGKYNKLAIFETCDYLNTNNFRGSVVVKSTIEPETVDLLSDKYENLSFIFNPEFLTARTAFADFHNQKHIILGKSKNCLDYKYDQVVKFYQKNYPDAEISKCSALEAESVKIYLNCFYAAKVQFFTELHQLCKANKTDFNKIRDIMLKNNWINKMHTNIPGPDGKISYGGLCFPKDTCALLSYMNSKKSPSGVLNAVITERNEMREDNDNIM